ncbi:peptide deformylase [Allorhizobium borbori]|jgi:peptide deformylase|uniref:Peptide deformylase-like n=1 Tax=Allorhizobium borbori TaxID=485907 RepID=A0A7W6K1G3_9HYPH|nr:peptide deformylase [Allorhizobium borbori]MBB4102481.1 peptide deformylase [Allorhizobium borbori]PZU22691.1 MAG: peptide deformylase [Shinella sp.]
MTIRTILRYPNPGLFKVCAPVTVFDGTLRTLADDLAETMRAAPGVGITAAHIGVDARIFVLELSKDDGLRIYVNPEILESSKATIIHNEGSVSMPGAVEEVERPTSIRVRYQDLDGAFHDEAADGFHAVCIQHEIDQLDGIFWLQRLSRLKRERLVTKWKKAQR